MTAIGVFRDDFYNASAVLTSGQYNAITQTSGTIAASNLAGAQEVFLSQSGATALTTDTASNIVARLQNAVAVQTATQLAAGTVNPAPPGVPNLTNLTYFLRIINTNGGTLTVSAGTGVTITGTNTLSTNTFRDFLVTVTGPAAVTFQSVGTGTTS